MQSPEGGSGNSPLVSVTPLIPCPGKDILPSKDTDLIHPRRTLWTHQLTYPEWKRRGVLGLPPDDDCDPSDEQQQQHSHCCEHGVSREHLAGPLGQDQAQDYQQENCKGQGGEQAGLQKPKTPGPWVTASPPMLPTSGRATVSPRLLLNCSKHTAFSMLSIPEYSQREVPLLTKQGGTSIDNLPRFPGGDGAGREPQTL